jgi:hypothetical protein
MRRADRSDPSRRHPGNPQQQAERGEAHPAAPAGGRRPARSLSGHGQMAARVARSAQSVEHRLERLARQADTLSPWITDRPARTLRASAQIAAAFAAVAAAPHVAAAARVSGRSALEASTPRVSAAVAVDPLQQLAWAYAYEAARLKAQEAHDHALVRRCDPREAFKAEWNHQIQPEIWAHNQTQHHEEIVRTVTDMAKMDAERVASERVQAAADAVGQQGFNPELGRDEELARQLRPDVVAQTYRESYANAVRNLTEAAPAMTAARRLA